jgi:hypothetical protein
MLLLVYTLSRWELGCIRSVAAPLMPPPEAERWGMEELIKQYIEDSGGVTAKLMEAATDLELMAMALHSYVFSDHQSKVSTPCPCPEKWLN